MGVEQVRGIRKPPPSWVRRPSLQTAFYNQVLAGDKVVE